MSKSTKEEGSTSTPAVIPSSPYLALREDPGKLMESIRANMGGKNLSEFDLDRVKVPSGGALTWEIPGLVASDSKTLDGVIVAFRDVRAYWREKFSGAGSPPDCSSADGERGKGDPGGPCERCPYNAFGSAVDAKGDQGAGKACKEMRLLFMLREGDRIPIVVIAPPTSLRPIRKYFLRLANKSIPYYGVVSRIELEKAQSRGGITYGMIKPSLLSVLDDAAAAQMKAYAAMIAPALSSVSVDQSDVDGHA